MAYDNNINPGNPPLVWSRIRDAFDKINENFTVIGSTLAREEPKTIVHVELGQPVRVTTLTSHGFADNQQVTITGTGISQLDNRTYYVEATGFGQTTDQFDLYIDDGLLTAVNGAGYDAYPSSGGTAQALSEYASLDFENLTTNVSPIRSDEFNLGSSTQTWQQLYLSEYSTIPGSELNGVWLGTAQIKGSGGTIDLPLNSTVNGELIINPDNTFFKSVQIDNGDRIVADNFVDTLNLLSGNGVSMAADSGAESITFTNTGVLSNIAGSGISVSSATGNITITNTGVRSLTNVTALPSGRTEGVGININGSTGDGLKITNTGVLEVQAGSAALTVFTDAATGIVTITNASPAGNAFRFVDVDGGATTMEANSVAGTLNLISGYGIALTGDAGTDTVTVAFDGVADIKGSVFGDDSTKLVDAVENKIYAIGGFFGDLTGNVTGNITGDVTGNVTGNLVGDTTGYHTGDVKGSIFGDDSTKLVDAVEGEIYGDFYGTLKNQTWTAEYNDFLTIKNDGTLDPEYNNGPIIDVIGDGSDFFKREVTANGVRIMGAGTVGGQTAVPDAWLEKVARMFELFTDPDSAGINQSQQRALIKTLSGDTGTYHAGLPTIQRVARGAGADYSPNFLTDQGITFWNLTDLFDNTVQNDMVWYLNSTGAGYGDGDQDAQEVIEHVFHTLHMHGLPADDIKLYQFLAADWQTGDLYAAMEEAYDAGKWDPSGYQSPADAWKTDADAFEVAAKEYLFLLNFAMFEYTELWDGGSLAPEWTDDMRTQAGILANNPLGYAFHNTYIAPVISKPSLATIRSIFQDGNTPAQDDPSLAGASGYVVDTATGAIQIVATGDLDLTAGAGYTINANRNIVASGGVTGDTTGYHIGDVTGSVFADDSTMLVDGTNGVLRGTHIGDVIGSVFADNSTMLVNGVDGTLYYDPGTPANWNGDAPTTVGEALDRIAAWIKASDGTGA
jgi:hypothetical protein